MIGSNPLFLREEELAQAHELIAAADRALAAAADPVLDRHGLGRAHQRFVRVVGKRPGVTVAEALETLKVTKQSASRVIRELTDGGYLTQGRGRHDRRQRTLTLTDAGRALERELSERQHAVIASAYREAGAEAVAGFRRVMLGMLTESDRARIGRRHQRG